MFIARLILTVTFVLHCKTRYMSSFQLLAGRTNISFVSFFLSLAANLFFCFSHLILHQIILCREFTSTDGLGLRPSSNLTFWSDVCVYTLAFILWLSFLESITRDFHSDQDPDAI